MIAGAAMLAYGSLDQTNASLGGFILIGPIPIVFGSGANGGEVALLSFLMGGLVVVILALLSRRHRTLTDEGAEETDK